ncbi:hypothetical protein ACFFUT_05255 [Pseudohalocynthiibacter aestuariivivens]|uniref:Uncharacterized protein n=1 Tax=Pseudohalocynthiibacter aestuariivivens TaxID=1591409 RepID=A0ABV5JCK4_9RHOB|nr:MULTISPECIES: hypothetical protein [Pseudohalocynthiibacter]MBS9718634.1 hypothetical protein [Pseudohalocynthiibacter aestuariivivens]MCK0103645.1 hypothetical protein [Pseudohalocynthiibacter sp. F2068]
MAKWRARTLALVFVLTSVIPATAETSVGSNIDSRVVLAFKVNDDAVQSMLPDRWVVLTLPKGPFAGTNLLVAFIDRHLALDPEGKPLAPHNRRSVAIVAYGVNPGFEGARMFVTRVYETPPVASSYDNGVAARISRDLAFSGPYEGARNHRETWVVEPETGGTLNLSLAYQTGRPVWSKSETTPYSAANPDFHRIYRYEQLADLAMSTALGRELVGEVTLQSSVPELAEIFDGSEALTGVLAIPVYTRDVFLP